MLVLSVCSRIYISLCLFGYGDGFSSFFFMKKTSYTLNSRAQFLSHPIHLFIHSSLRISLVENENLETQEKKKNQESRIKNQEEGQMSDKETENYQMFGN